MSVRKQKTYDEGDDERGSCNSIVMTWSAPAHVIRSATSFPACATHCLYPGLGVNELSFDGKVSFDAARTAPASSSCGVPSTNEVVDELPRRVDISDDLAESRVLLRFGVLVP